jgi:hypothetical protein
MSDKHKDPKPTVVEKAVSALKYPISAAAGVVFGHRHARNALYDTLKKREVFDVQEKILDAAVKNASKSGSLKGRIRPQSIGFNSGVSKFLKEKGFNNTIDYIAELHPNQQIDTALAAFSAASIALGVMLTIGQNKSLMERFSSSSKDSDQQASR